MLEEYERKRLDYHLAVNELNKFRNDFEKERLKITKRKYNSDVKKMESNIDVLKSSLDDYFEQNKDVIVDMMLNKYLDIDSEYNYYAEEIVKSDNGENFVYKKEKEEIIDEINELREKVQKRYDNKVITSIIFNDLNRCLDLYQGKVLNKWKTIEKKRMVSVEEFKVQKKKLKNSDENVLFIRLILPLTILDVICILFILINGNGCEIGSSEVWSGVLCSFAVMSNLIVIFLTPILGLYFIVKGIKVLSKKNKK